MPMHLTATRAEGHFFRVCFFSSLFHPKLRVLQLTAQWSAARFVRKNIGRGISIYSPPGGAGVSVTVLSLYPYPEETSADTPDR